MEDHLSLRHLQQLMSAFEQHGANTDHTNHMAQPGLLSVDEFKDTVAKVLGTRLFDDQLHNLFIKVLVVT